MYLTFNPKNAARDTAGEIVQILAFSTLSEEGNLLVYKALPFNENKSSWFQNFSVGVGHGQRLWSENTFYPAARCKF